MSQETTTKRDDLTETVTEYFHVLKSDKQTKQGLCQAVYLKKMVLASGSYNNNIKVGRWSYYDTRGRLIENFDYSDQLLLYEEPADYRSSQIIFYAFDEKFNDTDIVTKPIKIGGRCSGYIPYIKFFELPKDFDGVDMGMYTAVLELLISPLGKLADYKIHIQSGDYDRSISFSPELIDDADKLFIPATRNRHPILSRIFVKFRIDYYGNLDVY